MKPVTVLAAHKFALGQTVVYSPEVADKVATKGKVTRLLPKEGADYQYHVQFGPTGPLRRAKESQLRAVA